MTIERWIVQEWNHAYEAWYTWGKCGSDYRFWTWENAKNNYAEHKTDIHYAPCMYRYCKIVIQPESILNIAIHSTFTDNDEEINLTTQTVEQDEMKFT